MKYETSYEVEEDKSFVDLTDIDYYIVNPTKYLWNVNSNKWEKRIVKDGNRHNQLFKDHFLADLVFFVMVCVHSEERKNEYPISEILQTARTMIY